MTLEYITNRALEGKNAGKVKILKVLEESDASVEYTCPECGFSEKKKESWIEPFVKGEGKNKTFCLQCKKCNFTMKILKLKKEIKKK